MSLGDRRLQERAVSQGWELTHVLTNGCHEISLCGVEVERLSGVGDS